MNNEPKCPRCKAKKFNVHSSQLSTDEVECSKCGHTFSPAKPRTSRLATDGRSASKVAFALLVIFFSLAIHAQTNSLYSAKEVEMQFAATYDVPEPGGWNGTLKTPLKGGTYGEQLSTIAWNGFYGGGATIGIADIQHPAAGLLGYSSAGAHLRLIDFPVKNFSPQIGLEMGNDFTDGSKYTEASLRLEYRFTPRLGVVLGDAFRFNFAGKSKDEQIFGVAIILTL